MKLLLLHRKVVLKKTPGKGGWTYAVIPNMITKKGERFGWVLANMVKPNNVPPPSQYIPEQEYFGKELSLNALGFMNESRRLANARVKRELHIALRYPTVREGLQA